MVKNSHNTDQKALKARCDARKSAEPALQLLAEMLDGDPIHFWKIVRDHAEKQLPAIAEIDPPMTDSEAIKFGNSLMPYGKYSNYPINSVPVRYLDWLVGENDEFKDQLRRYVKNDDVRRRFADEIDDE